MSQWQNMKSGRNSVNIQAVRDIVVSRGSSLAKRAMAQLNNQREQDLISSIASQFSGSLKAAMGEVEPRIPAPPMYSPNPIQRIWASIPHVLPPFETDWVAIASAMTGVDASEDYELLGDVVAELRERNHYV